MDNYKTVITNLFSKANVTINGKNPWDIQVHNESFYKKIAKEGKLGFGESYMDGWWDVESLDQLNYRLLKADVPKFKINLSLIGSLLRAIIFNQQSRTSSKRVAKQHYNLTPELFFSFLDPYRQYSCGYFKDTQDLNEAQEKKLKLICDKLQLKPTDKVLDIGCGWGGLAKYAAEHYGCEVTGVTISEEQYRYAVEFTKNLPVKILLQDYRDLTGKYNKIVSIGMFEHVGYKNYRTMMEIVNKCLTDDGIFLLHTIGGNRSVVMIDPWINKYIFPGAMLPSIKQITRATQSLFILEDWHNFGTYYDPTLMAWFKNFEKSWPQLKQNFDERFYRMWKYYLLCCAGVFRSRTAQLWQIVYSKKGLDGGYKSIR